jgi:ATP-dependent Clp protease ATP-binding subunit ClpC
MYERFTDRARKVMELADQEARFFNHEYVGTEHILLGLVKEGSGVAANVLKNLDIDLRKIRLEVERIVQPGPDMVIMGKLPTAPEAKKGVEYAIEEARNLNHHDVGTEHLLLGLLRERESVAVRVLINLGLKLEGVRARVLNLPGNNPVAEESGETSREQPPSRREPPTPALDSFGRDLTELARQGKLDPAIGRTKETEQVIEVLGRRAKKNPMLFGEPGVKTAIVQGLAQRIAGGLIPEFLRARRIVALDLATLVGGDGCHGQREDRIKAVLNEARLAKNVILFVEEFHNLVGAGGTEGVDASPLLVPVLARNEIQFIGGSTLKAYREYIERDGALERRFQPIFVNPPSREEMLEALKSFRDYCETHHRVRISDEAVATAVELSDLYQPEPFFPQSVFRLMDEAAAAVRHRALGQPPDLKQLDSEMGRLNREKETAVAERDLERAVRLRDQADLLKKRRGQIVREWQEKSQAVEGAVGVEAVIETLSLQTGIPTAMIRERDTSLVGRRGTP